MSEMEGQEETICLMDSVLASQVAAGEVVERPASVVKELVENSIDAGATLIRVEVERGGLLRIRVSDDGCGMSRRDAQMCLLRHATSKLLHFEQLFDIRYMGFRGEAIPSIASVSHFSITTRREHDVEGTLITVDAGIAQEPRSAGCSRGTVMEVRELFYNTPARRKFLKSVETETAHIEHQLMLHALCYPAIRFVFKSDASRGFDSAATKDLRLRIADFFDRDLAQSLIKVQEGTAPGVSVQGYLLPLEKAKRNRKMQYLFLNGRPIEDKMILRALRDGYGGLPTGLHPVVFLYLQVEPALVDVNVHPAKKEVRFRRTGDVCSAVIDAVAASLSHYAKSSAETKDVRGMVPVYEGIHREDVGSAPEESVAPLDRQVLPERTPSEQPSLVQTDKKKLVLKPLPVHQQQDLLVIDKDLAQPSILPHSELVHQHAPSEHEEHLVYPPLMTTVLQDVPNFRHIGTLAQRYALFENKEGLVLLSPRAARERLIFERLMKANKSPLTTQGLLLPVLLEMDARDLSLALELQAPLEKAGFRLSVFGQRTLRIEAIPALLPMAEVESFMLEFLEIFSSRGDIRLSRARNPYQTFSMQLARQYAMKEDLSALLQSPMHLLADLLCSEIPYCTPTGKPTLVPVSLNELMRKFNAE